MKDGNKRERDRGSSEGTDKIEWSRERVCGRCRDNGNSVETENMKARGELSSSFISPLFLSLWSNPQGRDTSSPKLTLSNSLSAMVCNLYLSFSDGGIPFDGNTVLSLGSNSQ
jgi:hypothetical protein